MTVVWACAYDIYLTLGEPGEMHHAAVACSLTQLQHTKACNLPARRGTAVVFQLA